MREGYGHWLFWLKTNGLLEATEAPDLRCSPARLLAYVRSMQEALSRATVLNRVIALERALCAMVPNSDRSHLRTLINNLPKQGQTSHKRVRLQEPADIVELGLKLMRDAERGVQRTPARMPVSIGMD